jgi:two-component system CheB/CheR fusion protein
MSRGDLPPYILLGFEDLTEHITIEEMLRARATDLDRERQRRNEFLAMLGHELRNPLAALTHGLDLLRLGVATPGGCWTFSE